MKEEQAQDERRKRPVLFLVSTTKTPSTQFRISSNRVARIGSSCPQKAIYRRHPNPPSPAAATHICSSKTCHQDCCHSSGTLPPALLRLPATGYFLSNQSFVWCLQTARRGSPKCSAALLLSKLPTATISLMTSRTPWATNHSSSSTQSRSRGWTRVIT